MMNRRALRETVLKAIYAKTLSEESFQEISDKIIKPEITKNIKALEFAEKLFVSTVNGTAEADSIIEKYLQNWKLERLALIDRIILEMGITEFLHFEHIPTKVTINEYIEIAKTYSTGGSGKFINGILDSSLEFLNSENKITKTGRGLVDTSINTSKK